MADYSQIFDLLGQGANLYGNLANAGINNQNASSVGASLGQNASTLAQQIADLQAQINSGRQTATDAYNRGRADYDAQNQQLQGNIDTMTANLTALNDPNSPYMQMARQKIERADAAAGRRSQVGEREVQLAAMLADYVGKYAPGLNNSITSARNQIAANNNSLASLYANMNNAGAQQQAALNDLLRQQQQGAQMQNTVGRGAAQGANNSNVAALQAALGIGKGLYNMFGGNSGETDQSLSQISMGAPSYGYGSGITGTALGTGVLGGWGSGADSMGYTGANNFFGGGNLFGDPYSGGGGDPFSLDYWG